MTAHSAANRVHPTAFVSDAVEMGSGNVIMPYAVILGPCRIGDDNWFGPHCAVGLPAQYRNGKHLPEDEMQGVGVSIGNGNRIREFATVHQGSERETMIEDDCYLMAYSHVPHDAYLGAAVTLANAVQIGGHTWIGQGANIGLGSNVRQRLVIGALAMIGMNSTIVKDVPPFAMAMGSPARPLAVNRVGLTRAGFADEPWIEAIDDHYRQGSTGAPAGIDLPLALVEMVSSYMDRRNARDAR